MKQFELQIITPRGIFYEGEASIITLKISEGYVGLMANRLPLMSSVKVSRFTMRKDSNSEEIVGVIGNGIVKTERDQITIIARDVIWIKEASNTEVERKISETQKKFDSITEEGTRKQKTGELLEFWKLVKEEVN